MVSITSCNTDYLEDNVPEEQKQFSKAELIEQALSRIPQTRGGDVRVRMITIKDSLTIRYSITDDMEINMDGVSIPLEKGENRKSNLKFSNDNLSHIIDIEGSGRAIQSLNVDDNGLIFLGIYSNENLGALSCMNNHLDEIDWVDCLNLSSLNVANNEFCSIDLTSFRMLRSFQADYNRLTAIDVSKNMYLDDLFIGNNQITDIDVSENTKLFILELDNNPVKNIDLSKNIDLAALNVSYTQIRDLDLSKNIFLWTVNLENTPVQILNNLAICDTSFAAFSNLAQLNIAYTFFDSLDLSKNPSLSDIDISGSIITQLNISGVRVHTLKASRSKLTNLIYERKDLENLYELRIESTPFEKVWDNINTLSVNLPDRSEANPGHLYTYSPHIDLLKMNRSGYWLINQ